MGGVRDVRIAAALLLALPLGAVACSASGDGMTTALSGRERANALVAAYAAHAGAPDRTLDANGDVTFGGTGLHYVAAEDTLYGRAYVNNALIEGAPPEELANYRRMAVALNDPAIGGMFDRAGGYFMLDEQRQAWFLVRRFSVPMSDPRTLIRDMEVLQTVAARWTADWLFKVAMIMHGRAAAPKRPVTLADPR